MNDKDKHTKLSLVRTRAVIANKYRKLCRDSTIRDKELQIQYAPITKTIGKLVDTKKTTKENISKKNDHSKVPTEKNLMKFDSDDDDDDDVDMDSDWGYDPVFDNDKSVPTYASENSIKNESIESLSDVKKEDETVKHTNFIPNITNATRAASKIKAKYRDLFNPKKRRSNLKNVNGSKSYYSSSIDTNEVEPKKSKETYRGSNKRILDSVNVLSKTPKSRSVIKSTERKKYRENANEDHRALVQSNKTRKKREIISPEDYDADGNFVGLAPKRRKVERFVPTPTMILSPEDYGIDGHLSGPAIKRRKIEIPIDRLAKIKNKIARKLQNEAANARRIKRILKINKIKYGRSLERKFIPYAENIVYEYYDDPNELCQRLRLLMSSKSAGNSNHDQEINSIIEELRERHIIK